MLDERLNEICASWQTTSKRLSTFVGAADIRDQAHHIRGTDHKGLWLPDDDLPDGMSLKFSLSVLRSCLSTTGLNIASFSSPEGLFFAKLSAASTMAVAPILVFGWFSQRQLVQGLTFGAVK